MISSLLLGCSSKPQIKKYPNIYAKNISINVEVDTPTGFFSKKLDVAVGVNDVNKDCSTQYKGRVKLSNGENKLGLKTGKSTFIIIEIVTNSYSSTSSSFKRGTLIRPKKGSTYNIVMNYVDNMFDLRLYEIRKSKRKQLNIIPLSACKPVN